MILSAPWSAWIFAGYLILATVLFIHADIHGILRKVAGEYNSPAAAFILAAVSLAAVSLAVLLVAPLVALFGFLTGHITKP